MSDDGDVVIARFLDYSKHSSCFRLSPSRAITMSLACCGSELRRFGFTYSLCRPPAEWAIVVAAVHDVQTA